MPPPLTAQELVARVRSIVRRRKAASAGRQITPDQRQRANLATTAGLARWRGTPNTANRTLRSVKSTPTILRREAMGTRDLAVDPPSTSHLPRLRRKLEPDALAGALHHGGASAATCF